MPKVLIALLETITLGVCVYFGYMWTQNPQGNFEPWLFLAGLIFIALDLLRRYEIHFIKREGKELSPGDLVKHSEDLRKQFKDEIYRCRAEKLRKDVIVRHVNRMDSYPEVYDDKKGISPWFRAALLDTYHKGILVGLRIGTLTVAPDGYRFTNHKDGEKGDIKVCMVGKIPYEFIEGVNLEGDEYYNFPHIFCHFANKGEPYEEIVFSEEVDMGHGHTYYREVAGFQDVRENSVGWGVSYFS